jgi:hypothetical protein
MRGAADVTVSSDGHIIQTAVIDTSPAPPDMFTTSASDVLGQAHEFILNRGMVWHNDSLPSDFGNYLIIQQTNSSRLLDPTLPSPSFEDAAKPFSDLYTELFAIWMSRNQEHLLVPTNASIGGVVLQSTTRVFMSRTMFFLAESILALYILATIVLYIRRPWKVLLRLPTDMASVIAYFAPSRTVRDLKGATGMSKKIRSAYLMDRGYRFGFGNFIGRDGKAYVGIEKYPYVAALTRTGTFTSDLDKPQGLQSISRQWVIRLQQWKSGKAMEGGWM